MTIDRPLTLTDRLAAAMKETEALLPEPTRRLFDRFLMELAATGASRNALKVGDAMPSFLLPDIDGELVSADELTAQGPLVISFFRGHWCPYCNAELAALEEALPEIGALGATLVAITPELGSGPAGLRPAHDLHFRILLDPDNGVGLEFGVVFPLSEALKAEYAKLGVDVDRFYGNDNDSWFLPMPATFIVDRTGIVRHAFVDPDYRRRMEPAEILSVLKGLA